MSWDLAITQDGDLLMDGNGALQGKSGTGLIEQRMMLRLKLHRGSWMYDLEDTLGSQLYTLVGKPPASVSSMALAYVREALRSMTEISVDNVHIQPGVRSISILVDYHVVDDTDTSTDTQDSEQQAIFTIPVGG